MSTLATKISTMRLALENYKSGQPLPISINEIHFILGACDQLLSNIEKLEKSYKTDIGYAAKEVEKFRDKWKAARHLCTRQDNKIMAYRHIIATVKRLSWWRKSKDIKKQLASLARFEKKNKITSSNLTIKEIHNDTSDNKDVERPMRENQKRGG